MDFVATAPNAVDGVALPSSRVSPSYTLGGVVRGLQFWHLLSLDAPSIAMLWTWFLARSNHIRLPATAILAMGLAVWVLYAADRLLDARLAHHNDADLEPRHHFHRNHRRLFLVGIAVSCLVLAVLVSGLPAQAIRLYLVLGALLFAYFILIHADTFSQQGKARRLPKELAVGIFFSAATFIPTVARVPALRLSLLPAAVLFGIVCSLNCLFIYCWEHPETAATAHPATRSALRHLPKIAILATGCGLLLAVGTHRIPWQITVAIAAAGALLMLLHRHRDRLRPTTLRAAADLCLLTPLLLMLWLRY